MWQEFMLAGWNAPASSSNVQALTLWAQGEGTVGENNPLAISGVFPGATRCLAQCGTGSPVMAYATIEQGVAATVEFMAGSNSAGILEAFRADAGLLAIWKAINQSDWCRGCQDGRYPSPLLAALGPATPNPQPEQEDWTDMPAMTNGGLVRLAYRVALKREADPGGYNTFVEYLNNGGTFDQMLASLQDGAEGRAVIAAERKAIGLPS